jgi:uncharacterized protein YfaS (alpha-2-macroglobulin family)
VHPASFYVGVKALPYFTPQKTGLQTEIIAVGLDGKPVGGVPVEITLTQLQWKSVRRAEGDGFYTWDTERVEIPSGTWTITTAEQPVPLQAAIATGGYFRLEAKGTGADGRFATTRATFYVVGEGYTAWQRFDHNRIELTPEKQTWKPGETARIMIQSPWESATALVTTEREGISQPAAVSVDVDDADRVGADHGKRYPKRVRVGRAGQGPHQRGAIRDVTGSRRQER